MKNNDSVVFRILNVKFYKCILPVFIRGTQGGKGILPVVCRRAAMRPNRASVLIDRIRILAKLLLNNFIEAGNIGWDGTTR